MCHLPSKDEAYASDYGGPFLCIFTRCIEYGLQFPVRSFIVDLIRFYEISFSQVTPQGWRLLALFAWVCHQQNLHPTLELFRYFYLLTKNHGSKGCFYTFSRRAQESIPSIFAGGTGLADEKRGWKYEWFFYHFKGEHFEDWPLMNNRWVILETFSGINSLIKLKLTEDEWKFITDVAAKPFEEINVVWKNMLENKENILPLKYCEEVEIPDRSRTVVPFPDAQTKAVLIPDALRGSSSRQTPQYEGSNFSFNCILMFLIILIISKKKDLPFISDIFIRSTDNKRKKRKAPLRR